MFEEPQMPAQELDDLRFMPEIMVPLRHSGDPFACPCCANVFAEVLRLADIDLSLHAGQMPRAEFPKMAQPLLIENARIMTMNATAPHADTLYVEDGKIAWVGMAAEQPEGLLDEHQHLQRIDLQGKRCCRDL